MKLKQKIGTGALVALLVLVGVGIGAVCMLGNHVTPVVAGEENAEAAAQTEQAEYVPTEFRVINGIEYPVNENGLTYGSGLEAYDLDGDGTEETHPDLIAASASNGENGYVYWDDFKSQGNIDGLTLEEVLAGMRNNPVITVYAVDGVTEIGTYGDVVPGSLIVKTVQGEWLYDGDAWEEIGLDAILDEIEERGDTVVSIEVAE